MVTANATTAFQDWTTILEDIQKEVEFELLTEFSRTENDPHELLVFINNLRAYTKRLERSAMDFAILKDGWSYEQIYEVLRK